MRWHEHSIKFVESTGGIPGLKFKSNCNPTTAGAISTSIRRNNICAKRIIYWL